MQKHRISANIGSNQKINVELKQDFDLLEILSLKFSQKDIYTSLCSDYGVVVGRVFVNNGFGVPNAKVSIFVPLSDEDEDDPVISELYPYKTPSDVNEEGFRYNLLPARKQHGGHEATGTFPDQLDIINREEVLEVYEKYYKYTVKTNDSGDFMIWGVPIGEQILHIDLDLSDMGCFSLRPYDFIVNGFNSEEFKNNYEFNSSTNIDSLPQIKRFDKTIEVYPFWGNPELCDISITRTDFDLYEFGVKIEPKAYLIGGSYTDSEKMSINKNCTPSKKMGKKCELITKSGIVEGIRFTNQYDENNNPILEYGGILGEIDDDGSFLITIPMNMDYIFTNEFGENEYTNNKNIGIPTSSCYRFRLSLNDENLERTRTIGSYLVPNIREYNDDVDKSYNFTTNLNDYPQDSLGLILNNENGFYVPKDYFYRLTYNKTYTVSSFQSTHFKGDVLDKERFLGIKDLVPSDDNDCDDTILTPPVNFAIRNKSFQLIISDILLYLEYTSNVLILSILNILVLILSSIAKIFRKSIVKFISEWFVKLAYELQEAGQKKLYLITYPECDECSDEEDSDEFEQREIIDYYDTTNSCFIGSLRLIGDQNGKVRVLDLNQSGVTCESLPDFSNDVVFEYEFTNNYDKYFFETQDSITSFLYFYSENDELFYDDVNRLFSQTNEIYEVNLFSNFYTVINIDDIDPTYIEMEEGCGIYDKPYDESIVKYYYDNNRNIISYVPGVDVAGAVLSNTGEILIKTGLITKSGESEFSNGIFYIIPGTQTTGRLWAILREYYRRKRIGVMFCGGIVNYAFIDNWLSGSLYFFQFKSKFKEKKDKTKIKYCDKLLIYNDNDNHFYYRSTIYDKNQQSFIGYLENNIKKLGRPTTIVDLGPRDEFIKEICVDKTIDPNCSVSRSIGSTTYQNFGELLGYAINYRLEISDNNFKLNKFFDNNGFSNYGIREVLDGDILQLISINNETGIEEFDLQNLNYAGYSYQFLNPELYPEIFKKNGVFGPLPLTFYFNEYGIKIRSCLNQKGYLTESSQIVPFYLWDKKGRGFGSYNNQMDDQSWDYNKIEQQNLQGMYNKGTTTLDQPGNPIDETKYLLLPITYDYSGNTLNFQNNFDGTPEFDLILPNISVDNTMFETAYPGFTYLIVTSGTVENPIEGILWTKYGTTINDWTSTSWDRKSFLIRRTEDYYTTNKQILSTPFMFYFGLRPSKTGLDKFIKYFGPKDFFNPIE